MAGLNHSKPFGAQTPEQIAKDYGGNKAKIAQAMQLGIVDPTVGTLAGMFIDRMAAGAQQSQAPQGTVASQVFNPQTPPAQAPGGAGPGGLPAIPGAPPPQAPMPPQSPQDMQPMGPGMAKGGSTEDYRLKPQAPEERHNNLLELVRQFTGINQRVGDANVHGQYDPIRNTSDYGVDVPVAGGNFRAGARSSRGLRPDSFSADYSHPLLGGDLSVGARHDRGGTSGHVGFRKDFADGGMVAFADGGLATLPVPDDMFNSSVGDSDVQNYAPGGIVAFAAGDEVLPEGPLGPYFEEQVRALYPDAIITGRGRTAARNKQVGGVANSYHLTNNALDLKPPKGMSLTEFGSDLRKHFGPQVDTIFNTEGHYDHVHLEPSKVARRGTPRAAPAAPVAGGIGSLADQFPGAVESATTQYDKLFPAPQHEAQNKLLEYVNAQASPEALKKQAYQDKWSMLAEIGFGMASSNSPYLLQAIGEAASAALPGAKKAKEARDAKSLAALQAYAQAEGITNREALERRNGIMGLAKDQMEFTNKDLQRLTDIKTAEITTDARVAAAGATADAKVLAAETAAAAKIANAPMAQAIAAARQNILDRWAARQVVDDPDDPLKKWSAPVVGGPRAAKFIDELARRIAYKHMTTQKPPAEPAATSLDIPRTGITANAGANTTVPMMNFDKQGNLIQ